MVKEYTYINETKQRAQEQNSIHIVIWSLIMEQRQYNGEKIVSSTNGAGTTGYPRGKKNDSRHRHTSLTKINSKQITDLNIKSKMLKEDNIGENLHDLGYDNDFLDKTSKA